MIDFKLTALLPDPVGSDTGNEWIEIKAVTDSASPTESGDSKNDHEYELLIGDSVTIFTISDLAVAIEPKEDQLIYLTTDLANFREKYPRLVAVEVNFTLRNGGNSVVLMNVKTGNQSELYYPEARSGSVFSSDSDCEELIQIPILDFKLGEANEVPCKLPEESGKEETEPSQSINSESSVSKIEDHNELTAISAETIRANQIAQYKELSQNLKLAQDYRSGGSVDLNVDPTQAKTSNTRKYYDLDYPVIIPTEVSLGWMPLILSLGLTLYALVLECLPLWQQNRAQIAKSLVKLRSWPPWNALTP